MRCNYINKQKINYKQVQFIVMQKLSQTYFKQVQTKPSRIQSPDFKAGNSIRPTKTPENISYIIKQNEQNTTPPRALNTPNKGEPKTVSYSSKYFMGNKSSQIKRSNYIDRERDQQNSNQYDNSYSYHPTQQKPQEKSTSGGNRHISDSHNVCKECVGSCRCVHAAANQEVVVQLKKIITMINGAATVSPFHAGGEHDQMNKTIDILKSQNKRLSDLLDKYKSRIESKIQPIPNNYESQVKILREQLSHNVGVHQKQRQQLYRANKALSSQLKSSQQKNLLADKQLQVLRSQLTQTQSQLSQSQLSQSQSPPGPTPKSEKLSLSMIRDQYNSSLKTLQSNIQFQINNQLSDIQSCQKQYRLKISILQDRLKSLQKIDQVNKILNEENKRLKKWIKDHDVYEREKNGQRDQETGRLQSQLIDLENENQKLRKKGFEDREVYEGVIRELKDANGVLEDKLRDTDGKVKQLMQNYQKQIRILKSKPAQKPMPQPSSSPQLQPLRIQNQQYWQQILKLRNQLAYYTSQHTKQSQQLQSSKTQISRLTTKINSQHMNLLARTNLLESQNNKLRKQISDREVQYRQHVDQLNLEIKNRDTNAKDLGSYQQQRKKLMEEIDRLKGDRDGLVVQLDKIKNQHSKRQLQLRQLLKQQLEDTKSLYQQQLSQSQQQYNNLLGSYKTLQSQHQSLQSEYKPLQSEYRSLQSQYQPLQEQYSNLQREYENLLQKSKDKQNLQPELFEKMQKIREHQVTISNISRILEETQYKIVRLQENKDAIDRQYAAILQQLERVKKQDDRKLEQNNKYWRDQVQRLQAGHALDISRLNKDIQKKTIEENTKFMQMRSKMTKFKSQSLYKQLQQLKKLIDETNFSKLQQQLTKISESYQRELIRSEQKSLQVDSLQKSKLQLQQKIAQLQRFQLILQQKINILQGNLRLSQSQLRESKKLCENLLMQKLGLEKQNIMLKKVRVDKESIQLTKNKAKQISQKINRLLALEQERQNDIMEVSQVYTSMAAQSVVRKL